MTSFYNEQQRTWREERLNTLGYWRFVPSYLLRVAISIQSATARTIRGECTAAS